MIPSTTTLITFREPFPSGECVRFDSARFTSANSSIPMKAVQEDRFMAKENKKPKTPTHPPLEELAKRLGEIREELDSREQNVLDAEAERDAAKEHYESLHAAAFGAEYGVVSGGRGSDSVDKDDKPIPPNWDVLMGDIPEPADADDDK